MYPIADIKGTIGGSPFTLDIVLGPFTSGTSTKTDLVGHVVGTFRTQAVTGILTSRVNTDVIGFSGKIGALHLTGAISKLSQHGDAETAHASYDITK